MRPFTLLPAPVASVDVLLTTTRASNGWLRRISGGRANVSTATSLRCSSGTGITSMLTPASATARASSQGIADVLVAVRHEHDPLGRIVRKHRHRPLHRAGEIREIAIEQAFDLAAKLNVEIDRRHLDLGIPAEHDHARSVVLSALRCSRIEAFTYRIIAARRASGMLSD